MAYDGSVVIGIKGDDSQFAKKLNNMPNAAKRAATLASAALAGIGATLAGLGAAAMKTGADFESAFAGVKKTVDATDGELLTLRDGIRGLAKELPESASGIAAVAESAGQLGIQTGNILGFTKTMVQLGDSTNLSAEEAATSLARLANITGMAQTDFDRLGSVIVALGNNLATTEAEITDMSLRIAGAGSQVGMSEAQIMSFAAALSSVGIESEAGGTAVSTLISKMSLATQKGGQDLQDFATVAGVSSQEFKQAFEEDAASAILTFIQGLSTINDTGGSAIKTLDDIGLSDIRMRDALLRAAGASDTFAQALDIGNQAWEDNTALAKEATQRYETVESQLGILKNNLKDIGISIYDEFRDPLVDGLSTAKDSLKQLAKSLSGGEMKKALQTLAKGLGDAVGALGKFASVAIPKAISAAAALLQNLDKIGAALGVAAAGFAAFKVANVMQGVMKSFQNAALQVALFAMGQTNAAIKTGIATGAITVQETAVGVLTGKIGLVTAAQGLWNAAMAANPAVLITGAVVALGAAVAVLSIATNKQESESQKLSKRMNEMTERLREQQQAQEELKESRENAVADVRLEADMVRDYVKELETLVDENGRVKQGYEERAEYLANYVNKLIPDAISVMEDEAGAIYGVNESLEDQLFLMEKQMILKALEEEYVEAYKNKEKAAKEYSEALEIQKALEDELTQARIDAANAPIWHDGAQTKVDELERKVEEATTTTEGFWEVLEQGQQVFNAFDTTIATQNAKELQTATAELSGAIVRSTGDNREALEQQLIDAGRTYGNMVQTLAEKWDQYSQVQRDGWLKTLANERAALEEQEKEAKAGGVAIAGSYTDSLCNQLTDGAKIVDAAVQNVITGSIDAANETAKEAPSVGSNLIAGIAQGIKGGKSPAVIAMEDVMNAVMRAAKKVPVIKSPSKRMRKEVGQMLAKGLALGIIDGEAEVKSAAGNLSKVALEEAENEAEGYKDLGQRYMDNLAYGVEAGRDGAISALEQWITDDYEAFKKKLDAETDAIVKEKKAQMEEASQAQKDALQAETDQIKDDAAIKAKAHQEAGREVTSAYKTALTEGYGEALSVVRDRMTELTGEFQSKHDEIIRQQESMQSKLADFGTLFEIDDKGRLELSQIEENVEALERYNEALSALKGRGVSESFLAEVTALGVEEGTKFAEKLANMPEEAFAAYTNAWEEQQALAKQIAEEFYADQLSTLEEDFVGQLSAALESVPEELTGVGKDSIQGMIEGMYSKSGALSAAASEIVRSAISAMRAAADIHSPSKKTGNLVGKPLAEGIGAGFDSALPDVLRQMRRGVEAETARLSAAAAARVQSTFTNTTTKEIHSTTKIVEKIAHVEGDGLTGELVRMLGLRIKAEERRVGENFVKRGGRA